MSLLDRFHAAWLWLLDFAEDSPWLFFWTLLFLVGVVFLATQVVAALGR